MPTAANDINNRWFENPWERVRCLFSDVTLERTNMMYPEEFLRVVHYFSIYEEEQFRKGEGEDIKVKKTIWEGYSGRRGG